MMRTIGIVLFPDVELLDFCGPYEVFTCANKLSDDAIFEVYTVAETADLVKTSNGLSVVSQATFHDHPDFDMLLVPGGVGTRAELENAVTLNWIRQTSSQAELTVSVCTGALLLATVGLLDGLRATTHRVGLDLLSQLSPSTAVCQDRRYVDNGSVITSAGISAGIDMSLHIVRRLHSSELATRTANYMEYDWREK